MLGLLALGQAAQAANPLELNFWLSGPRYDGRVAECEAALGTITTNSQEKESTFWNSSLQITGYGRIHETAFRPWQSDNIPRRYCSGEVMLSDGKMRTVHYSIIEDGGFAGFGQGVEWCVTGLDRNWAYNPALQGRPALISGPFSYPDLGAWLGSAPSILFLKCSIRLLGFRRSLGMGASSCLSFDSVWMSRILISLRPPGFCWR